MGGHEFLCVSKYLGTEMDARAVKSALELGVLDALTARPVSFRELRRQCNLNALGLRLLAEMLEANGVVERNGELIALTPAFRSALQFRDLLETRIAFADLVWPDIHELFTPLLNDLPQFMARSKVFELFRYDRCLEITPDNLRATAAWTRFTTCLTRYESAAALDGIDLDSVSDLIDLGGNTGEFARRVCQRNPNLKAIVVDLPVVCALGKDHIAAAATAAEARRITFFSADMRKDPLPAAADLVAFKSVLHDWPEADAERLIERAYEVVRPGGRLLIFERAPIELHGRRIPYVMAPDLVFLQFLRPADLYLNALKNVGFASIEYRRVELDIGFHLIVARRPA